MKYFVTLSDLAESISKKQIAIIHESAMKCCKDSGLI